jgi:hypothetical protein
MIATTAPDRVSVERRTDVLYEPGEHQTVRARKRYGQEPTTITEMTTRLALAWKWDGTTWSVTAYRYSRLVTKSGALGARESREFVYTNSDLADVIESFRPKFGLEIREVSS